MGATVCCSVDSVRALSAGATSQAAPTSSAAWSWAPRFSETTQCNRALVLSSGAAVRTGGRCRGGGWGTMHAARQEWLGGLYHPPVFSHPLPLPSCHVSTRLGRSRSREIERIL